MDSRKQAQYFVSSKHSVEVVKGLIDDRRCFLADLERIGNIMKSNKSDSEKLKEVYEIAEFYADDE